jgi:hypothetical protein
MLTETLLIIPFSLIGQCSPVSTPHWLLGNVHELTCKGGFRYDFTESQTASCMHFQSQNRHMSFMRVTEKMLKMRK